MIATAQGVLSGVAEGVLRKPGFDPLTARTVFRFAMADVAEIVFLPTLLPHLQRHAPHATVTCASMDTETLKQALANGDIDLALGYFPDLDSQSWFQQRLYLHTYACMVRKGHPLSTLPMTAKSYTEIGHVVVSSPARSSAFLEACLEERSIRRRIVLETPHQLSLPAIVESTDLLATVPLATGARAMKLGMVALLRLPFTPPSFAVQQHWHPLVHHDARSQWLRKQVAELFNVASDEWRDLQASLYGRAVRTPGR